MHIIFFHKKNKKSGFSFLKGFYSPIVHTYVHMCVVYWLSSFYHFNNFFTVQLVRVRYRLTAIHILMNFYVNLKKKEELYGSVLLVGPNYLK